MSRLATPAKVLAVSQAAEEMEADHDRGSSAVGRVEAAGPAAEGEMMTDTKKLQCDMKDECTAPVTHIEEKGWIYCAEHAEERRRYVSRNVRRLRGWELALLRSGRQVPSYRPLTLREYRERLGAQEM